MSSSKVLEYNGYQGSIEVDPQDELLHGRILHINDLITYDADDIRSLKASFEEAVDDYLATCAAIGKQPDKPCSGTFNVRIGSALHLAVIKCATREGKTLNDFVREALDCHVNGRHQEIHHHYPELAPFSADTFIFEKSTKPKPVSVRVYQ